MGLHLGIEFADFGVYKAWQFFKYNVRRDPIFEVKKLMGTHQVKEVGGEPPTTLAGPNWPLTTKLVCLVGS